MLKPVKKNKLSRLKSFLDRASERMETPAYIETDPILFMYRFQDKLDRVLAGFLAAIMAWGRRDVVIKKVHNLMLRMDYRPAEFIGNFNDSDARRLEGFKHRTFKPVDFYWIFRILRSILEEHGSFEAFWQLCLQKANRTQRPLMGVFHEQFFSREPAFTERTRKHISNAEKNSSCKRPYLFLRWCLRQGSPVDPGLMQFMDPADLKVPLDVHVARQARRTGLLTRKSNNWNAVLELTENLKKMSPGDPAGYDYALFGIGIGDCPLPEDLVVNREIN